MKSLKPIFIMTLVIIFSLTACNLPANNSVEESVNDAVALTFTARALTIQAELPSPTPTFTETPVPPTSTNAPIELPTLAPAAATATPSGTFFVTDVGANCRSGPDTVYDKVTSFAAGAYITLVGHNADNSWWYVLTGNTNCWIAGVTGHTSGPLGGLPLIAAPPTPTVAASAGPILSGPVALIAELSYPSSCSSSNTIQVAIRVTDNGKGVDSVWLKYRYLGDGGYTGNWHTVTPNDNASGGVNGFNYDIGAEAATELGNQNGTFQYQFFAKDNSGNTSSYPNGSILGMPIKYCP